MEKLRDDRVSIEQHKKKLHFILLIQLINH